MESTPIGGDPTRRLRVGVYAVLIALAVGNMAGRILAVNAVNRAELESSVIAQRMKQAEAEFREVLRLDPSHPRAHNRLGVLALARKDLPTARGHFTSALRVTPGDALPVIEDCFRRMAAGEVELMPRRRFPVEGGYFAVMAATDRALGVAGLKSYTLVEGQLQFVVCLFDLANGFSSFYDACPVMKEKDAKLRASRLKLVDLTGRVIQKGLDLLGINTCEKM